MKEQTVAAVVVTYNRKGLLIECLDALVAQKRKPEAIFIIDNASTDGTRDLLAEKGYAQETAKSELQISGIKICYYQMDENTGGAGGFHEGVKQAFEAGYDWIWVMDDDAEPAGDALAILCDYFKTENVAALCPFARNADGSSLLSHRGFINYAKHSFVDHITEGVLSRDSLEIDFVSFVGFMVSRKAVAQVGFPNRDFFIHHDDLEYSIRSGSVGKILLITKSVIVHKDAVTAKGLDVKEVLGRKSYRVPVKSLWITYYTKRNHVFLGRKYAARKSVFLIQELLKTLKLISAVIVYDDHKLERIRLVLKSDVDGLMGNLGKRMTPVLWAEWLR